MRTGLLDMLVAVVAFTAMLAFAKAAGDHVSAAELVMWRGLIGGLALLPFVGRRALHVARPDLLVVRTLLGTSAMVCFYTSVQGLTLAEASLIQKIQPVVVAVAAPLVLGARERAEGRIWIAMALGLVGTAILLAPSSWTGSWWGLWAVAAAILSAGAHTTLRALGPHVDGTTIVLWFQLGAAALAFSGASLVAGAPVGLPPLEAWPLVLGVAGCATTGQLFMTRAYRREKAAAVAAMSYAGPLVAALLDLMVFGLAPGWWTLAGGVFVVAAGAVLWAGPRGRAVEARRADERA